MIQKTKVSLVNHIFKIDPSLYIAPAKLWIALLIKWKSQISIQKKQILPSPYRFRRGSKSHGAFIYICVRGVCEGERLSRNLWPRVLTREEVATASNGRLTPAITNSPKCQHHRFDLVTVVQKTLPTSLQEWEEKLTVSIPGSLPNPDDVIREETVPHLQKEEAVTR